MMTIDMTAHVPHTRPKDASMALLTSILDATVDPEYAAYSEHHKNQRMKAGAWKTMATGLLAGLLLATYALTSSTATDDAKAQRIEVIEQITAVQQRNDELSSQLNEVQGVVNELQALTSGSQIRTIRLGIWSASTSVTGSGVKLTINENPDDPHGIIVDQDLRHAVNSLWYLGAEAISINGQRLSARSAIRQAGGAVTVDYRSISNPFVIEAIGDPNNMLAHFPSSEGGLWLYFLQQNYTVSWTIEQADVEMNADTGVSVTHATRVEKAG